ncbi:MAG TPA: N-acetylneuraminate synthase family protein, partial [Gemmatimonadales bacterium]|nr:N-acetylneuraminate synthase family protein [Gemmatimonadales bacterium]
MIAEAGSCHDGDIEKAYKLIKAAGEAGVDAVKFQFWSDAMLLATRRRAPEYAAVYKKYQVPEVWLSWLQLACVASGVEFMSTVYLPGDIKFVDQYVKRHKIASF